MDKQLLKVFLVERKLVEIIATENQCMRATYKAFTGIAPIIMDEVKDFEGAPDEINLAMKRSIAKIHAIEEALDDLCHKIIAACDDLNRLNESLEIEVLCMAQPEGLMIQ